MSKRSENKRFKKELERRAFKLNGKTYYDINRYDATDDVAIRHIKGGAILKIVSRKDIPKNKRSR